MIHFVYRTKRWMASKTYSKCILVYPRQLALERAPLGLPKGLGLKSSSHQSFLKKMNHANNLMAKTLQPWRRHERLAARCQVPLESTCHYCVAPWWVWGRQLTGWNLGWLATCLLSPCSTFLRALSQHVCWMMLTVLWRLFLASCQLIDINWSMHPLPLCPEFHRWTNSFPRGQWCKVGHSFPIWLRVPSQLQTLWRCQKIQ